MIKLLKNKIFQKRARQKGFSLMEAVLSMFVLTTGIVATIGLVSKNIQQSIESRDTIIASNLAQEGIELVRNFRDNNLATKQPGGAFCSSGTGIGNAPCKVFPVVNAFCIIDVISAFSSIGLNCSSTSFNLQLRTFPPNVSPIYRHDGIVPSYTPTKFYRRIWIEPDTAQPNEMKKIESRVWWTGNNTPPPTCNLGSKCLSAQDILTNR